MPRVTICIPAYKAERYLAETLASVRAQTFTDWELIVTEDGSRDATEKIVREFAATVSQPVHYTRHDPNRGLPATRNAGISQATSEWIAILDADDLWTPDHLGSCMSLAEKGTADLIHGGSILFDSDTGKEIELRAPTAEQIANFPVSLFEGFYIVQPASVLLRRSLWEKTGGFDAGLRGFGEDIEMWIHCLRSGARLAYTGTQTCRYRKHANALSQKSDQMAIGLARVYEKHIDWDAIPRPLRINLCTEAWISAGRLTLRKDAAAARSYFARSLKIRLLNPRAFIYLIAAAALSIFKKTNA